MKNKFLAGITALYMMFGSCTYSQNNPNNLNEKNLESKVAYEDSFTVSIQKKIPKE